MRKIIAVAALAVLALAGCGSTSAAHSASDVLACQHYRAQGVWYKNLATPGLTEDAELVSFIQQDAKLATDPALRLGFSKVAANISKMLSSLSTSSAPNADADAASLKEQCRKLGVTV